MARKRKQEKGSQSSTDGGESTTGKRARVEMEEKTVEKKELKKKLKRKQRMNGGGSSDVPTAAAAVISKQTDTTLESEDPACVAKGKSIGGDQKEQATVEGLQLGYVICPTEMRFLMLLTFLKKNRGKKGMVFMSTACAVGFFDQLLPQFDLPVKSIHESQKESNRTNTFMEFSKAETGVLLCTDVAARGLDIPAVDWIVQYDPPDDPKEYIHRMGRAARGEGGVGSALLILRPEERGFLDYLKEAKIPLKELEYQPSKLKSFQAPLEKLISRNYALHKSALDAYKAYVRAYARHTLNTVFNIEQLQLKVVAKSLGLLTPPFVELGLAPSQPEGQQVKRQKMRPNVDGSEGKKQAGARFFKNIR